MNQRIEKLAKKAGAGEWGDSIVPAMMDVEKFAQLIVLECANYASRNWEHGHLLAQDLKTHFGVE